MNADKEWLANLKAGDVVAVMGRTYSKGVVKRTSATQVILQDGPDDKFSRATGLTVGRWQREGSMRWRASPGTCPCIEPMTEHILGEIEYMELRYWLKSLGELSLPIPLPVLRALKATYDSIPKYEQL